MTVSKIVSTASTTISALSEQPQLRDEWMRTLRDLPPASCMRTTQGVAIAVRGTWQQREPDDAALEAFAEVWHRAGFTPQQWWALAASVIVVAQTVPRLLERARRIAATLPVTETAHPREFSFRLSPEHWLDWPALAAEHGALRATIALLCEADQSGASLRRSDARQQREAAIRQALKPVRISEISHLSGVTFTQHGAAERA